jgi:ribosomal protein S18 acetylase RimI-like enzyme
MLDLQPPFRPATPDDAHALADLVNFASEGFAHYLWTKLAGPAGDAWAVGRGRLTREGEHFSYRSAVVAEAGGKVAAGLIGYRLPDRPEPIAETMPAMIVPLQELENLAPGSWYVHVLAAYPEHRNQRHGTALLALAERLARAAGCGSLSLIVSDTNTSARRLYERCGYGETARRTKIKEDWDNAGTQWVLMTKPL